MNKIIKFTLAGALIPLFGCVETPRNTSIEQEYISMVRDWGSTEELASVPTLNWESKCQCKIVYSNEKIASFKIISWSYTGGAHGMTVTKVGTVQNGKILKLADLPSDVETLWQLAITKHFKAKSYDEYAKKQTVFKPYITENFYLDDKGIHFIYDPYEIDCFAAGTIDIFVPYKFK